MRAPSNQMWRRAHGRISLGTVGCAINWTVLLGFTRALVTLLGSLAWPAAALLIAVQFKGPIGKAIDRMKRFSAFGAEADLPTADQQQPRSGEPAAHLAGSGVGLPLPDPLATPLDEMMVRNFDTNHLDDHARLAWAIRTASVNWLWWRQENHYRLIFGSQIAALKLLAQSGPQTAEAMRGLFDTLGAKPPPADTYTFESWMQFLLGSNDIEPAPGAQPIRYQITPLGRHFLSWLPQAGASEQKPF